MSVVLSIIVPIYNVEQYLPKCLDSILIQNFYNFELILVNDGSTDRSKIICEIYAEKDKRIIILNKKNGGLSSARNYGIDIAKGEYISFVDSDDWLVDNSLGDIMSTIIETKSDILIAGHYVISDEYVVLETHIEKDIRFLNRVESLDLILKDKDLHSYSWDKIYKTTLFNNIRFPEGRNFEDTATTYKLFNIANRIIQINKGYYNYLRRKGSISLVYPKNIIKDCKNRLDNFTSFYERSQFTQKNKELHYLNNLTSRKAFNLGSQFIRFSVKKNHMTKGDIDFVRSRLIIMDSNYLSNFQIVERFFLITIPKLHLFSFKIFYLISKIFNK